MSQQCTQQLGPVPETAEATHALFFVIIHKDQRGTSLRRRRHTISTARQLRIGKHEEKRMRTAKGLHLRKNNRYKHV